MARVFISIDLISTYLALAAAFEKLLLADAF